MYDTEEERIAANKENHRKAQQKYRERHAGVLSEKQKHWQRKYDAKRKGIRRFVIIEFPQPQELDHRLEQL
jgi:hypothetical protein